MGILWNCTQKRTLGRDEGCRVGHLRDTGTGGVKKGRKQTEKAYLQGKWASVRQGYNAGRRRSAAVVKSKIKQKNLRRYPGSEGACRLRRRACRYRVAECHVVGKSLGSGCRRPSRDQKQDWIPSPTLRTGVDEVVVVIAGC